MIVRGPLGWVLGAVMIAHGLDQSLGGAVTAVRAEVRKTHAECSLEGRGVSPAAAQVIDPAIGIGGAFGVRAVPDVAKSLARITKALTGVVPARGAAKSEGAVFWSGWQGASRAAAEAFVYSS